ncbi:MAG: hypothetical protein RL582_1073 [Bacteroidota bacterium]|jgi:hypothetical protein
MQFFSKETHLFSTQIWVFLRERAIKVVNILLTDKINYKAMRITNKYNASHLLKRFIFN